MFSVELQARKPLYEQITEQMEKYILVGLLKAQEQIPSVRALSLELNLNPNTVQRAYIELDRRGIIYSQPGKGSFISDEALALIKSERRKALLTLRSELTDLAAAGVEKSEILALLDEIFHTAK